MKRTLQTVLITAILMLAFSCDKKDPIGKSEDNIHLSTDSGYFDPEGDSTVVTTQGDTWWLASVMANDHSIHISQDFDISSDTCTLQSDEFFVQKRDKHTLFISLPGNFSGQERFVRVTVQSGNYFGFIQIRQPASNVE